MGTWQLADRMACFVLVPTQHRKPLQLHHSHIVPSEEEEVPDLRAALQDRPESGGRPRSPALRRLGG
eukprot:11941382-Alexandrium_andersonii.AAC.1